MKKMFFPKGVNVGKTGFVPGQVNEVEDTPGSVDRWLIRGCLLVEEEPIIEEKKEVEKKVEEKEVKKPSKKKAKKKTSTDKE